MAQQVEHVLGKDEVTSSNLVSSSKKTTKYGGFFLYTENPAIVAGFQRAYSYAKKSPCVKIMLRSGNSNGNTRRFIK